jgi:pimeloyl-ACP methyl ester carboxylesterase
MKIEKIAVLHTNGNIDGVYINAGNASPLVIIINGHNGFYNYGMFPHIQQKFYEHSISTYSFNFSHGGVIGDGDTFEDLEKYEQNCIRLETEDLFCVLQNVKKEFNTHSTIFLFAHSLGGVPTIFGVKKAVKEKIKINGIILVSTVKTLNFWPAEILKEWATAGVYYKKNNRTKQDLPMGFEFLQEIINCDTDWNVKQSIQSLDVPILIIHGANDEAIPVEHAESLFKWITSTNSNAQLKIIPNASHTFNTKHPFENTTKELEELINISAEWINSTNQKNSNDNYPLQT